MYDRDMGSTRAKWRITGDSAWFKLFNGDLKRLRDLLFLHTFFVSNERL